MKRLLARWKRSVSSRPACPGTGPSRLHAACACRTSSPIARQRASSLPRPPMVLEASASRSMSASACDELLGARRRLREEALDLRDQLLHLLTAGLGVELGAAELIGMADHHPLERGDEPLAERIGAVAHDR